MKMISSDNVIFTFNPDNKPATIVEPKDKIKFITKDCFGGRVKNEKDLADEGYVNPCTGPLYIEGAMPGDTLKIKIEEIIVDDFGLMVTGPDMGGFGHLVDTVEVRRVPIKGNFLFLNDELKLPIEPMIGVIGTTPSDGEIPTYLPGKHGGNMDMKYIQKGNILYLPVFIPGGLLAIGDLHAAMGDGETSDTGVEVGGEVILEVDIIKEKQEKWPILETPEKWYTIASGENYEEAAKYALEGMFKFVKKRVSLDTNDIVFLLGISLDLEICQIVNPLITLRGSLDKKKLESLGIIF
ncbi:MAG TPA: acetamidase [Thermoanaerobacterales bacterium]|nr:acetamidase [Thermoanaerobacterales bacterium]